MAAPAVGDLRVRLCIDLSADVVGEAKRGGDNLIVAYHPQLFRATNSFTLANHEALLLCAGLGISVFSPHTSIDPDINSFLLDAFKDIETQRKDNIIFIKPIPVEEVTARIKAYLKLDRVRFADGGRRMVGSIAVCAGAGGSMLAGTAADLYWTGEMGIMRC